MESLKKFLSKRNREAQTLSLGEYLEMVAANPGLARGAHAYLYDALTTDGVDEHGIPLYFRGKLVGANAQIREFMALLKAGAMGQDIRRRIILLVGPPGSAKSTFVFWLKRAIERYSMRPEGAIYRIQGCPINEDPLRAIYDEDREEFYALTGIKVEQHLCPYCAHRLKTELDGDISRFQVERFYISEAERNGIGTFAAGEPNTQDASHLIGAVSLSGFQTYGSDSHPMAWSYDGALLRGNRGIAELIELLKAKPELMHYLLVTAQERQVPVDRIGFIDVDMVLVAHTNYAEFRRFWQEPRNEAIRDRVRVVEWPYSLRVRDEEKIYSLMMPSPPGHLAPWTLRFAATLAVLSRLQKRESDSQFPPMLSLKLYNTEYQENHYPVPEQDSLTAQSSTRQDYDVMRSRYPEDGKDGLSPRVAVDWITAALVASDGCVNPVELARHILASYKEGQSRWTRAELEAAIESVMSEYNAYIDKVIQRAFASSFEKEAEHIWKTYLAHASADLQHRQVKDPITGRWSDPDRAFLRRIEEAIGISEQAARNFRSEILALVGALSASGNLVAWNSDARMAKAIEAAVMADKLKAIRATISSIVPDEEQEKILEDVRRYLIEKEGFCEKCVVKALDYYANRMRKGTTG